MTVSTRLTMFNVYFLRACCRGNLKTRIHKCDIALRQPSDNSCEEMECRNGSDEEKSGMEQTKDYGSDPVTTKIDLLSFTHFRMQATRILSYTTWYEFYSFINAPRPSSKAAMAHMLRRAVRRSRQLGYHKAGMDFSRVHA